MSWKVELGGQIQAARNRKGFTILELAKRISRGDGRRSRVQLRNYELGKSAIPVNILAEIAAALEVDHFTVAGFRIVPETPSGKPVLVGALQMKIDYEIQLDTGTATVGLASEESRGDLSITARVIERRSA